MIAPETDTSWLLDAACRGTDTTLFFPTRGDNTALRRAKKVCSDCPVQANCLQEALSYNHLLHGVWGGTSERQRRRLRLQTNAQPQKVPQT